MASPSGRAAVRIAAGQSRRAARRPIRRGQRRSRRAGDRARRPARPQRTSRPCGANRRARRRSHPAAGPPRSRRRGPRPPRHGRPRPREPRNRRRPGVLGDRPPGRAPPGRGASRRPAATPLATSSASAAASRLPTCTLSESGSPRQRGRLRPDGKGRAIAPGGRPRPAVERPHRVTAGEQDRRRLGQVGRLGAEVDGQHRLDEHLVAKRPQARRGLARIRLGSEHEQAHVSCRRKRPVRRAGATPRRRRRRGARPRPHSRAARWRGRARRRARR